MSVSLLDMVEVTASGPGYEAGIVGCAVDRLESAGKVAWVIELEDARGWKKLPTVPEEHLHVLKKSGAE